MSRSVIVSAAVVLLGLATVVYPASVQSQNPPPDSPCTTDAHPQCAPPSRKVDCPKEETKCLLPNVPPTPTSLICTATGGVYVCEAFPQDGSTITYAWTSSPSVTLNPDGDSYFPYATVSCMGNQSGTATVSVTNGTATTAAAASLVCPVPNAN